MSILRVLCSAKHVRNLKKVSNWELEALKHSSTFSMTLELNFWNRGAHKHYQQLPE